MYLNKESALYRYGKYLIISSVILLSHLNFLFPDKTVSPDASFILMSLNEVTSFLQYFQRLVSFEALDFLPIRDVTLYFDMFVYQTTGTNISIFINCVLWGSACLNIFRIMEIEYPDLDPDASLLAIACLAVHPIFSQLINWSMARKHLLAIYFTTLATLQFLRWIRQKRRPWFILSYLLSLLSVPISLLWPVWAFLVFYRRKGIELAKEKSVFAILFLVMILIGLINVAYYSSSPTFLKIYPPKSLELDPQAIVIHIAFLFNQMLFPYKLSFTYSYSPQIFISFGLMVVFVLWLLVKKRSESRIWFWLFFWAIHTVLFLKTPEFYNDTYAAIPVICFFFILVSVIPASWKRLRYLLIPLTIFWGFETYQRNPVWGSTIRFYTNAFEKSPTCHNSRALAKAHYLARLKLPNELYEFLQIQNCLTVDGSESPATTRGIQALESMQMYFETDIDLEFRKKRLVELGQYGHYPLIMYALLMAQENETLEIERVMEDLNSSFDQSGQSLDYDAVYYDELASYCTKYELSECKKFIARIKTKTVMPFF